MGQGVGGDEIRRTIGRVVELFGDKKKVRPEVLKANSDQKKRYDAYTPKERMVAFSMFHCLLRKTMNGQSKMEMIIK